ncbi:hypothetical protein CF328_g7122, partial [Tilletia controversa]
TPEQIVELLSHLPAHTGGLNPLAYGLYHPASAVRNAMVEFFSNMCSHPVARKLITNLSTFHRLALARLLNERESQINSSRMAQALGQQGQGGMAYVGTSSPPYPVPPHAPPPPPSNVQGNSSGSGSGSGSGSNGGPTDGGSSSLPAGNLEHPRPAPAPPTPVPSHPPPPLPPLVTAPLAPPLPSSAPVVPPPPPPAAGSSLIAKITGRARANSSVSTQGSGGSGSGVGSAQAPPVPSRESRLSLASKQLDVPPQAPLSRTTSPATSAA